jgi:hypothetical protein
MQYEATRTSGNSGHMEKNLKTNQNSRYFNVLCRYIRLYHFLNF